MNVFLQSSEFLRQNLALDALAEARAIEVTDADIAEAKAGLPGAMAQLSDEDFEKRGFKASLSERIRRDKALQWLLETVIVDEA